MTFDADVAVIGLGAVGAQAAWRLAKRGVSVLGFDQFAPGNDLGGAGGDTRLFRTLYHEGPEYVPHLRTAYSLWRELEQDSGTELLQLTGGLMLAPPDHPGMRSIMTGVQWYDLPHEQLDLNGLRARFPTIKFIDDEVGVWDPGTGLLRSNLSVLVAAAQAEAHGAQLLSYHRVTAVDSDLEGVTITAEGRTFRVRQALVAAGPWVTTLLPELRQTIATRRMVATWFQPKNPSTFTPDVFPALWRRGRGNMSVFPSANGDEVKVNGYLATAHVEHVDPEHVDRSVHFDDYSTLRQIVLDFFPGLYSGPIRHGVYMDGYTADRKAVVGTLPHQPRVAVMAGFSGHGFKLAPFFGELAASILTDTADAEITSAFSLDRSLTALNTPTS